MFSGLGSVEGRMLIKARYACPVHRGVIQDAALSVRDGRIVDVAPADRIDGVASDGPPGTVVDYGDAVVVPGFINAHTHLELSGLHGLLRPSPDFTGWLRALREAVAERLSRPEQQEVAVRAGIAESLRAGVTSVGDITAHPLRTRAVLARSALGGVSFGEVIAIGTGRGRLDDRLAAAADSSLQTDRLRAGISPHAPYTLEPAGLRACAARSIRLALPLCVHAAETREEREFTEHGTGLFRRFLRDVGVWDPAVPATGLAPIPLLHQCQILGTKTVVAHCNYVTNDEIRILAGSRASVAFCPRTHDAFGHDPHPFADLLRAGVNVCLGTDSLTSNPDLSILGELRFLRRRFPGRSTDLLLELATIRGARALGLADRVGTLEPGKCADLTVLPLEAPANRWDLILEQQTTPLDVFVAGERVPV